MKNIFLILITLFLFSNTVKSQDNWTFDMYETVSHEDFRQNKLFQQEYDLDNPDIPLLNAAIFFATNEQRVKKRRSVMKYHKTCEITAYNHSMKMVERNFFSHTNKKNRKRRTPNERAILAGIKSPSAWGENIAYNFAEDDDTYLDIADKLLDQWMHSKGHKKNILDKTNVYFGCGAYPKDGDYIYATQFFIRYDNIIEAKATDKLPPLKK